MINAIHIGDYKTASTWLQLHAFQQHPEVVYIDSPNDYPEVATLFYELVDITDLDFDADSLRERFKSVLAGIKREDKKLVVSREALFGDFISGDHARRIAERLFQVFGPVKILMVIREQFSMLASIYSQYVKIGGTLSLEEFVWDPFVSKGLIQRLKYDRNIEAYSSVFGSENISVRLFDELKESEGMFLNRCFTFIGCKKVDFVPVVEGSTNLSLTTTGVFIQRVLNHFIRTHINPSSALIPFDKMIAPFLTRGVKEFLLQKNMVHIPEIYRHCHHQAYLLYAINMAMNAKISQMCEKIRFGKKIVISDDIRTKLESSFKESNHTLVDRYALDLNKYGWIL